LAAKAQSSFVTSQKFNPAISANGLFLYQNGNRGNDQASESPNGYSLQEAELQLTSDVDVYARASVLLSIHQENGEWHLEPEEAFGESLNLPYVTLKAGKFKAALGKYNTYHTHAYPFIDANLINQILLGEEGLNESGVSIAGLLPVGWYSEVTLQSLNVSDEGPFDGPSPNGSVSVAHFTNLWDLSDDLTLEWGLSGAIGPNAAQKNTSIWGSDLTFKWRPARGGKYHALIWSTEYLHGDAPQTGGTRKVTQGASSFIQWQFTERWWLQARGEYADVIDSASPANDVRRKESLLLGYLPTEFSGYRLQYDHLEDNGAVSGFSKPEDKVSLQVNITIGAHPAHSY
jgi:hypothetical protein